jgi:hypothetical protein
VRINFEVASEESIELLVLNNMEISDKQFADFEQGKEMKIIYTDHFSDDLWSGYPSIEPTKRMREYKKH